MRYEHERGLQTEDRGRTGVGAGQISRVQGPSEDLNSRRSYQHAKQVKEVEQRVGATKAKLKELGEASEDAGEQFKDGVESAWGALSVAIRNATAKFKS
jgi:hypothetical protein